MRTRLLPAVRRTALLLFAATVAQAYGERLYTGVFFRHPEPGPTFERLARERQDAQRPGVKSRADVLNVFRLKT